MDTYAIRTEKLCKRYRDTTAVDGLDLCVQTGELFALLGVNGAGKTTTIRMLCAQTKPTSGDAFLLGDSVVQSPQRVKAHLAVSPQETAAAPNLSVRENLAFMCGIHGFDHARTQQKIDAMTERFCFSDVLGKKAGKLSGGWQRRLSIAMALISEPEILFLDEPTLGLDVIARAQLWEQIRALKGKTTILLTTHYMEEAEALADRIGIMRDGRLLLCGTADEIKEKTSKEKFEDAFIAAVTGVTA